MADKSNLYFNPALTKATAPKGPEPVYQGWLARNSGRLMGSGALALSAKNYDRLNSIDNKNVFRDMDINQNREDINYLGDKARDQGSKIEDIHNNVHDNTANIARNTSDIQDRVMNPAVVLARGGKQMVKDIDGATAPGTEGGNIIHQIAQGLGLSESEVVEENSKSSNLGKIFGDHINESTMFKLNKLEESFKNNFVTGAKAAGFGLLAGGAAVGAGAIGGIDSAYRHPEYFVHDDVKAEAEKPFNPKNEKAYNDWKYDYLAAEDRSQKPFYYELKDQYQDEVDKEYTKEHPYNKLISGANYGAQWGARNMAPMASTAAGIGYLIGRAKDDKKGR